MNLLIALFTGRRDRITFKSFSHDLYAVTALVMVLALFGGFFHKGGITQAESVTEPETISSLDLVASTAVQYKTTIDLNLRTGPGTNYKVLNFGAAGTTVTGTGKTSGGWYEVKLKTQTGWMSGQYLKKIAVVQPVVSVTPTVQYKTTIHLNLRTGPGTNYKVLNSGVAGTTVTGTGKTSAGWNQVKLKTQTGWMSAQYLKKITVATVAPKPLASTSASAVQYKTTIYLNLRSGAGTKYSVISSAPAGTTVTGTGATSGSWTTGIWYQVKLGSKIGWMSADYLRAATGPNTVVALQAYAGAKLNNSKQLACLVTLWNRESNWNYQAFNPAYAPSKPKTPAYQAFGIAQAAPGSKMATFGSDWQTNPRTQILWGLDYIKGRYGTPCAALTHSNLKNWY